MPKLICSNCKRFLRHKPTLPNIPPFLESITYLQTCSGLFTVSTIEPKSSTALPLEIPNARNTAIDLENLIMEIFGELMKRRYFYFPFLIFIFHFPISFIFHFISYFLFSILFSIFHFPIQRMPLTLINVADCLFYMTFLISFTVLLIFLHDYIESIIILRCTRRPQSISMVPV